MNYFAQIEALVADRDVKSVARRGVAQVLINGDAPAPLIEGGRDDKGIMFTWDYRLNDSLKLLVLPAGVAALSVMKPGMTTGSEFTRDLKAVLKWMTPFLSQIKDEQDRAEELRLFETAPAAG